MSKYFKLVLFVRSVGYFLFLSGFCVFLFVVAPVVQAEVQYRADKLRGTKHNLPSVVTSSPQEATSSGQPANAVGSFGNITTDNSSVIVPVSTDFGIVIEKINANARVVADVDPTSEADYTKALMRGVAHARGTNYPGEAGNVYLFSHSTDAPWNIVRYNAVFYLLRELESGDRVVMFYKDRRYDYIVKDKQVVNPTDVSYLSAKYDKPVLTLQTCDPPGTLFKRLIIRAQLVGT